jgi:Fe-S-cluster-containing dehydrogenase component
VKVCPAKATWKREEDGVVVIDYTKCIHCNACVAACPYGARKGDETHRKPPEKCNFCVHRLEQGLLPACVETCIGRARVFGDLNDPKSEVSRLVRENKVYRLGESWGTKPNILYIGLPEINDREMLRIKSTDWQR